MAAMLTVTFTHPFDILPSSIENHKSYQLHHKFCIWRTGYLPVSYIHHPRTYT